jgi:hypothetical protein
MTLTLMILNPSASAYSTLYNDQSSGANADVQFWRAAPVSTGQGTFLPVGDICEASPSSWIYNSVAPLGQVTLVSGVLGEDVANPVGFQQQPLWTDSGSGAKLNGSIWVMMPPAGFVALGHVCTVSASGAPPAPNPSNYFCVTQSAVTQGRAGAQIWNTDGSSPDTSVSIYGSSAEVGFIDLHAFWAVPGSYGPPTGVITNVLLASKASF